MNSLIWSNIKVVQTIKLFFGQNLEEEKTSIVNDRSLFKPYMDIKG